jgi:hypothetical protein
MKRIPKLHFTQINRFLSLVDQAGGTTSCWPWQGFIGRTGYGLINIQGEDYKAHRVSYFLANGRIDDKLMVLHRCDVRSCVNPAHLFQGTAKDNSQDAVRKGRNAKTFGERHGNHKLTKRQVEEIRQLCQTRTMTQKNIAKRFGVCESTVYYVAIGERWKT